MSAVLPAPASETAPAAAARARARARAPAEIARLCRRDWYKDAIIYQLHVKAFQDANGDGIGDFAGLIERLDYIEQLGVTALWLLPFYPSPLRDDGYDISDYRRVNPTYGTMRDFRRFVDEAHRRGISVITELVINHTSDQHPWFQRARRARKGTVAHDFYVWSDTAERYQDTRLIFLDTETSNWTWDPEAGRFFWHRFYSHQPDLNFDNPRVLAEVLRVMRFWLEMGVDGLRLDAIPYLIEREGTSNENLPETHEILRRIRAELDRDFPDRMLLAEANQWPEDTRPYFGEGDECHMAFHFPLMPRMYMAVAQEDRHPITDIMRQTPEIPEICQWAIFLRNHDELTLEMVTDRERDYLWRTYAQDARARINLGIRRRLAPLMQNDQRKIELMNGLLLSMPGTPVIYYGDEIGMGDNIYVGDRDGVRTPMQWSTDRNGGFSRANPQQLYLPLIMDPVYGYQAVNVEAQQADPSSPLNWLRRMIAVRKQYQAFGRGSFELLYPSNRRILAYTRSYRDEIILCVINLARTAQAVELDLSQFRGRVPIELVGRSPFPPIGDLPYLLTLHGHGFFWFLLAPEAEAPSWHTPVPEPLPEFVTLTLTGRRLDGVLEGRERRQLERDVLPQFLERQRWYGAKGQKLASTAIAGIAMLSEEGGCLSVVDLQTRDAGEQRYLLPLNALWGEENLQFGAPKLSYTLARVRRGARLGALIDGAYDERFARDMVARMVRGETLATQGGSIRFVGTEALRAMQDLEPVRPLSGEQSNVSIALSDQALLKIYRRLRAGAQPEIEVARFLSEEAGFANTPAFLGAADWEAADGETTTLATAFAFVRNQGDAWSAIVDALDRALEQISFESLGDGRDPSEINPAEFGHPLSIGRTLGERTGEMHAALATPTKNAAFRLEPMARADIAAWTEDTAAQAREAFTALRGAGATLPADMRSLATRLLERRKDVEARIRALRRLKPSGGKSRIHGDYHLGQVLLARQDVFIIDFEGEPRRSLEERRGKSSPLRDVAGMLRSFDYALSMALGRAVSRYPDLSWDPNRLVAAWRRRMSEDFLAGYRARTEGVANLPADPETGERLLELFLMQKAFYEINYELANRPDWVGIPIEGVLNLIEGVGA